MQEQLQVKISENKELQDLTNSLREQLAAITVEKSQKKANSFAGSCREGEMMELERTEGWLSSHSLPLELKHLDGSLDGDTYELRSNGPKGSIINVVIDSGLQTQVHTQVCVVLYISFTSSSMHNCMKVCLFEEI